MNLAPNAKTRRASRPVGAKRQAAEVAARAVIQTREQGRRTDGERQVRGGLRTTAACAALTGALLLSACSAGHATRAPASVSHPAAGDASARAPGPRPSLREAVTALLTAEEHGDHASSFRLLDDEGRRNYADVLRWRDRRNQLPAVTGFQIQTSSEGTGTVDVLVDHAPGLDPFVGLSPAHEHERWVGRQEHGGWLLDAEATSDPVLPSEAGVVPAVMAWVRAAEACDAPGVRAHQAVDPLLGTGNAAAQLCSVKIAFSPGAADNVQPGTGRGGAPGGAAHARDGCPSDP